MEAAQTIKMTEEKATQTDNLLNSLVDHTTQAVIATEMFILAQTIDQYCHRVSDQLLAMDDETLRNFTNVDKFAEAFIKGWHVWKLGQETEAFETFCTVMK